MNRTISFTFALAGGLAGAAGLIWLQLTTIRFDAGFQLGLVAFTAAVLGGIGNFAGAVLGALVIGLIQAFNARLSWLRPAADGPGDRLRDPDLRPRVQAGRNPGRANAGKGLTSDSEAGRVCEPTAPVRGSPQPGAAAASPGRGRSARSSPALRRRFLPGLPGVGIAVVRLVFTMMALGLNIVVGYAGLLDLGYVAF